MITAAEIYRARSELTHAVSTLARQASTTSKLTYRPASDAPDTWSALQNVDLTTGVLPVWDGASADSLYLSAEHNYIFRFWHDLGHLSTGLGFTPDQEAELQHEHHLPAVASLVGADTLAYRLYHADTVGQIDYVVRNLVFPADQLTFDLAYIDDADRALALV